MAKAKTETTAEQNPNDMIECEVWKTSVKYKYRVNEETGQSERYVSEVIKTGTAPIKITLIERRHITELNSHVENSNLFYYQKN